MRHVSMTLLSVEEYQRGGQEGAADLGGVGHRNHAVGQGGD